MTYTKMDTQGMSMPLDPNDPEYQKKQKESKIQPHKPWLCTPTRILTETMVKELKILINEVLDEREYKRRLEGPYDNVEPLPPSYFDTKHFQYYVGEEEPEYKPWSQSKKSKTDYNPSYYQ